MELSKLKSMLLLIRVAQLLLTAMAIIIGSYLSRDLIDIYVISMVALLFIIFLQVIKLPLKQDKW